MIMIENNKNRIGIYTYSNSKITGPVQGRGGSVRHYNNSNKIIKLFLNLIGVSIDVELDCKKYSLNKKSLSRLIIGQEYIKNYQKTNPNFKLTAASLDYLFLNYKSDKSGTKYEDLFKDAKSKLDDKDKLKEKINQIKTNKNEISKLILKHD